MKRKQGKQCSTAVHFGTRLEIKRAYKRARLYHGNYGFSTYVRKLIAHDIANPDLRAGA